MLTRSVIPASTAPEGKRGDMVDWRERAACAPFAYDPNDDPFYPVSVAQEALAEGLQICAGCPVLDDCWDHAQATESLTSAHGIRAGRTSAERKTEYRRRQRANAKAKAA